MPDLDLVVRNGTVVTAADTFRADIGVRGGRIVALAEDLPRATQEIDAAGRPVLPGGVDSHCHIEQLSGMGIWNADDFYTGTVAAAFGGTTTVIPFAAQHRGQSMRDVVADYRERAKKAVIDHAFHMIVSDPSETVMAEELPALIRDGYSSLKLFMTYPLLRLDDGQMLDLLSLARRERAMISVHAENDAMIAWVSRRLLERGHTAPRYHAISHPRVAEAEAVGRLIAMAALVDQPIVVFHVTTEAAMAAIRDAQTRGQKVFAETCPQYLLLEAGDLDKPGLEGAKWMFSPPARDGADRAAMWRGVQNGTFQIVSSDHAPYRFDRERQARQGPEPRLQADRERHPRHRAASAAAVLRRRRVKAGSVSSAWSSCAAPTRPRSTGCIRRRARSRSDRTLIWRSGTLRRKSRSPTRPPTTLRAIAPMPA